MYELFNKKVPFMVLFVLWWFYSPTALGQALTENEVRFVLASSGIENSFKQCASEDPYRDSIVAYFLYHKDGRLEFITSEPQPNHDVLACFESASEKLVLKAPGRSYNISYPMELKSKEEWAHPIERSETNIQSKPKYNLQSKLTRGNILYAVGVKLTLVGSGGLLAGHVLMLKERIEGVFFLIFPFYMVVGGNILSLIGLKTKQRVLHDEGVETNDFQFKASVAAFIIGASISTLVSIAFLTELGIWSLAGFCELDPEECSATNGTHERIFNRIWIGLGASHVLLLLTSIIPKVVYNFHLNKKSRILKETKLASVPFVSYAYIPGQEGHVISLVWSF